MKKLPIHSETFQTLLESYKSWLEVLGYAESTVYNLPNHLREFFYYLEKKGQRGISLITNHTIKDYYKNLSGRTNARRGGGLSKAFLNKHQQALKLFQTYLKEHNVKRRFGVHLKGEKIEQQRIKNVLTQSEIKQLFDACDYSHMQEHFRQRDRTILALLYSCGLRRNEAVHVNCSDILFEKGRVYVRKGKNYKERFVPINTHNLQMIEEYMYDGRLDFLRNRETDSLLVSHQGKRMGDQSIALRLEAIIESSDNETIREKGITLHTLRHSIATHLLQNKVPMKSISKFLGHSSLESTQIYTHLAMPSDKLEKSNEYNGVS